MSDLVDNATPLQRTAAALGTARAALVSVPRADIPTSLSSLVLLASQAVERAEIELERLQAMENVCAGIGDVFYGDVHVPRGTTLTDQVLAAKADGLVLLIAKCTEGGQVVPPPYVDPKFRAWSDAARAASVTFGGYHFERTTDTGASQARFFFNTLISYGLDPKTMLCALDHEPHRSGENAPDPSIANDFAKTWFGLTGRYPWIYCDESRAGELARWNKTNNGVLHLCPLWLAIRGGVKPWPTTALSTPLLIQYLGTESSGAEIPTDLPVEFKGLGKLDRSAFQGTADELLACIATAGIPVASDGASG